MILNLPSGGMEKRDQRENLHNHEDESAIVKKEEEEF